MPEPSLESFSQNSAEVVYCLLGALALQSCSIAILRRYQYNRGWLRLHDGRFVDIRQPRARRRSSVGRRGSTWGRDSVPGTPPSLTRRRSIGGANGSPSPRNLRRRRRNSVGPGGSGLGEVATYTSDESDVDDDEMSQQPVVAFLLCSMGLASALSALSLLPITVAFVRMMPRSLLERFWNYSFTACSISLYGIMPYCYLLLEANGRTWFARTKESLQTAVLFWLLGVGFIYSTTRILGVQAFMESHPYMSALNILVSLPCGLVCGFATPYGVSEIFGMTSAYALPLNHRTQIASQITELEFEIMALENQLHTSSSSTTTNNTTRRKSSIFPSSTRSRSSSPAPRNSITSPDDRALRTQIKSLTTKIALLRKTQELNPFIRLLLVGLSYGIYITCFLSVMLRILLSLANNVLTSSSIRLWGFSTVDVNVVGEPPPLWWVLTEFLGSAFFTVATVVGFYALVPQIKLRPYRTTARHLIANVMLLLVVAIALPLICRALGVADTAFGPYAEVPLFSQRPWAMATYKVVMLWLLGLPRTHGRLQAGARGLTPSS
ncbi:uncharacterized protein EV422DRAFT_503316 [Fimicolochytrium jonesii]|uniref:uncharacterized protein n=1 Tax=Fimicolochytrium jonesii TaxID=1396493 RepID=UPI0022FE7DDE|nr:uncharacterized protein EV422DRAFT_503316 [Fimicolochytrium jonesii]KAI8825974.1 hypothetical protein EV422DRAFT_503316 [Fimicolochytrium jonesii]